MSRPRTSWSARLGAVSAALALVAVTGVVWTPRPASGAVTEPTVTVTPTTDLVDGRQVSITVRTTPNQPVYVAEARVCRAGVAYAPSSPGAARPSADFTAGGDNCSSGPISTSADSIAISNTTFQFAPTEAGETFFFRVGTGRTVWTTPAGDQRELVCGEQDPCALVVQLRTGPTGAAPRWVPFVFELSFKNPDVLAACGGATDGVLSSAGSDALADAWIAWTLATCKDEQGQPTGAWSGASFGDEGNAVGRFGLGALDLVYTGLGYRTEAALAPEGARPAVAVPVALGASVIGVGNGYLDQLNRKRPFGPISLTAAEAATLVSGGEWAIDPYRPAMQMRNPELARPDLFLFTGVTKVGGPSEGGTVPFLMTRFLDARAPEQWRVPNLPLFLDEAGRERGVSTSMAVANPSFTNALTLYTGRPGLARVLGGLPPQGGGIWQVVDLTTARLFDLRPVALQNSAGAFVEPSTENKQAAVAGMQSDASGVRLPDPNTTSGYPLTYVVYALAPAEPLADPANGQCRVASQQLMDRWLNFLVGDGQQMLPSGLAPLTPELKAEAQARIAEVGATPAATPCTIPAGPAPAPQGGGPGLEGGPGATGDGAPGPVGGATGAPGAARPAAAPAEVTVTATEALPDGEAELVAATVDIPGFAGGLLPSWALAIGALAGIVGLVAVAARATSSRVPDLGSPTP